MATTSGLDSASVPPACECWSATLRIVNLCQSYCQGSPSASSAGREEDATADVARRVVLADTLAVARSLVQHWGTVNGCANVDAHMDARMLCYMTDAVSLVLRDHENALDTLTSRESKSNAPRIYVGRLELDAVEAAIVAQEALKHSLIRLALMPLEIEEEAALLVGVGAENPLGDRDVKALYTRLFRMLGIVNRLDTI